MTPEMKAKISPEEMDLLISVRRLLELSPVIQNSFPAEKPKEWAEWNFLLNKFPGKNRVNTFLLELVDKLLAHAAIEDERVKELEEKLKQATELIRYYADSTNFEAVNIGRNYNDEWIVEEYNPHTVCGQEIGKMAQDFLRSFDAGKENK